MSKRNLGISLLTLLYKLECFRVMEIPFNDNEWSNLQEVYRQAQEIGFQTKMLLQVFSVICVSQTILELWEQILITIKWSSLRDRLKTFISVRNVGVISLSPPFSGKIDHFRVLLTVIDNIQIVQLGRLALQLNSDQLNLTVSFL